MIGYIEKAEAILIAGGDQWNSIRLWKDTPLCRAIQRRIDAGVPIGGTSAGLAVLGDSYFTVEHDSITSEDAVQNPFHEKVSLGSDFLNNTTLQSIITDSHFLARKRIGRLATFLARSEEKGIGVDEATALLVEPDGRSTIVGRNSVWFLTTTGKATTLEPSTPLTLRHIEVFQIQPGGGFNVRHWKAGANAPTALSIDSGVLSTN